ncbi:MAG: bifunctional DNA primase/polymerase, partial [Tepidiformaceae bacterium]
MTAVAPKNSSPFQSPSTPAAIVEAALAIAARGWAVFPVCEPRRNANTGAITCACGRPDCDSPAKHPRIKGGVLSATTDEVIIRSWWRKWPSANVGIAVGAARLAVLDIDPGHGGDESLRDLRARYGVEPFATRTVLTGGGGEHLYFVEPPGADLRPSVGLLGPGLDIRAAESYVVAPPSRHATGRLYQWENEALPILPFPEALVTLLTGDKKRGAAPVGDVIPQGERDGTLASLAGTMRSRGMSASEIEAALLVANSERCVPPLSDDEVRKVARSVGRYEPGAPAATRSKADIAPTVRVVCLADVEPEPVTWLWEPYVPRGKLTIEEGDPGVGKSHVTLAITTHVSLGHGLPGVPWTAPANVLLLGAEDGLGDTVRPRLDRMGADVSRITAIEGPLCFGGEEGEAGLEFVEAEIRRSSPALVVLDPLVFYLGGAVDLHRANEVRAVTARLALLAEKYRCAILAVRHLTKGGRDKAIYRGIGSIDLTAAARSVLLVGCDPDDPAKRAIAQTKCNLAPFGPPVGYSLADGLFTWTTTDLTAGRMLAAEGDGGDGAAKGEAEGFLREALAGGARPAAEVKREALACGIAGRTLDRAKAALGVTSRHSGVPGKSGGGTWDWRLPE